MILKKITQFSNIRKLFLMFIVDSFMLIFVLLASFSFRLNTFYWPNEPKLFFLIFFAPLIAIPIFYWLGVYKTIIRYIGFKALWQIAKVVSVYAILWGLVVFLSDTGGVPRSVILINWLLIIFVITSSRIFASWLLSEYLDTNMNLKKVVIFGSGAAGRQLSNALNQSNEFKLVAFVDDDIKIQNKNINGLEVLSREKLKNCIEINDVKEVFLAIPSISRNQKKEIIDFIATLPVIVRTLPSVSELTKGKVRINDLLEIDIQDLLGRSSVKPITELLKVKIFGKVVLISGAGGSIGSELARQIVLLKPKSLILFELSESSLYQVNLELSSLKIQDVQIFPIIGSVGDKERVKNICKFYSVDTIYHAAAFKHVPLVEYNQAQGVINNIFGTLSIAQAAIDSNVETFVLISTDKAVRPTNTMGATKRISELILQGLSELAHNTCFTMVRFGNVLDSSGSVIPLFKKQIKEGGPITLTHMNVVRYFMTISEAVELVIQAGALGQGGDVFVLDMGKPVKIYDLAVKMVQLSGLTVKNDINNEGDIEITCTGLRPGEKLYEELLVGSNHSKTQNNLIMRAEEISMPWNDLKLQLDFLKEYTRKNDHEKIRSLLIKLVPEFSPQSKIIDLVGNK